MRFLADENFPVPSIRRLREERYNVAAIIEDDRGCDDTAVMARAVSEGRVILTFDRDYGELIYRLGLRPPAGVIYLRDRRQRPFEGKFTVVERDLIRQRLLPE